MVSWAGGLNRSDSRICPQAPLTKNESPPNVTPWVKLIVVSPREARKVQFTPSGEVYWPGGLVTITHQPFPWATPRSERVVARETSVQPVPLVECTTAPRSPVATKAPFP